MNFLFSKITLRLLLAVVLVVPHISSAAPLTNEQASSLINVVQSSPDTPASAFTDLITAFSNITIAQAESLITVVQASSGTPADAFVGLLVAFTVDSQQSSPADSVIDSTTTDNTETNESAVDSTTTSDSTSQSAPPDVQVIMRSNYLNAAPGATEHKLAELEMQTDENVTVNNIVFEIKVFKDGGQVTGIKNVSLVDGNGNVLAGPADVSSDGTVTLRDTVTIKKGTHAYHLRAALSDLFTSEQTIGVTPLREEWDIQRKKGKETTSLPFNAADMFVNVSNIDARENDDGTRSVHLTIESQTDLNDLHVRMVDRGSGTTVLSTSATRTGDSNVYEASVSNVQTGVYDVRLVADASGLIGISKIFEESIGVD